MSTAPNEPAAPFSDHHADGRVSDDYSGFTAKEAAAIALRVPDSGNDWLDAMIRTAQRNDLAKAAMQGLLAQRGMVAPVDAFEVADAMLAGAATQIAEGE